MYANARAQVRWGEADVSKCMGVGTLVRIRIYANAGAQVRKCGSVGAVTQGQGMSGARLRAGR